MQKTKWTQEQRRSRLEGVECHIAAPVKLTDGDVVLLFSLTRWPLKSSHCKTELVIRINLKW